MTASMSTPFRRLLALAIAAAIPLLAWMAVVQPVWSRYQAYQNEQLNQTALLAKFQARAASLTLLQAQRAELEQRDTDSRGLLRADTDALAAAHLQAAITKLMVRGGGSVASMQVLPPSQEGEFQKVRINANVRAPMLKFFDVLYGIEAAAPFIFIDSLNIRSASAALSDQSSSAQTTVLSIRLQVSSFRKTEVP